MERDRPVEAVLLLNASYIPLGVISWMKAVSLLWQERAEAVVNQELELHSPSMSMPAPSVVRLNHMVRRRQVGPRLSRRNLFYRDAYTCQYCGRRLPPRKLNIDHVIPRGQGGGSCWENLVTSCIEDNIRKGGRTPKQARMNLLRKPIEPRWGPADAIYAAVQEIPEAWEDYLGRRRKKA
jgi:5-methylcytosine-specific restriction endonuclease McrA